MLQTNLSNKIFFCLLIVAFRTRSRPTHEHYIARLPKVEVRSVSTRVENEMASARWFSIICLSFFSCQIMNQVLVEFLDVNKLNVFAIYLFAA